MKPESKRILKPKLRFPEFRDSPGWTETKLADVLTEHGLRNDGNCRVHSVSVHKGIVDQIEHLGRSYAAADTSNYNLVKPRDVVYTKSPTGDFPFGIVKQSLQPYSVIVSPLYGVFSPINEHLGYILDAYFESPIRTTNYLAPITQKGAKNTIQISNQTFLSKGIYLPSDEREHQKIAAFLTSLDELIDTHDQKLDALNSHRKGLMQQLFPSEGESIPRLRFPDFQNAGEWERKTLNDIAEISSGTTPPRSNPEFFNGGTIPWVKTMDLNNSFIIETEEKITPNARARVNPAGSVLVAMYGGFNQMGRTGCLSVPAATNQAISVLVVDNKVALPVYVLAWLNAKVENWKRIASSSRKDPNITGSDVADFPISLPEIQEQQKIAHNLSSLDDLITALTRKLDALKTHKKRIMQQLFPPAEEVDA